MSEIINNQIDSYYTTKAKVKLPLHPVAKPPEALPSFHLYSDKDANNRMKAINQDIYVNTKKEEKSSLKDFIKIVGFGILAVLTILGIKRFFKKS